MAGFDRCIVLSSQAFTALIPLLILVSTLAPPGEEDVVAKTIISKFRLTGESAAAVEQLFEIPDGAVTSVSVASAFLLLYSGVSFTRRLQAMYRATWGLEKAGVRGNVFATLGLFVLLAEVLIFYGIRSFFENLPFDVPLTVALAAATGVVLWTSIPFLLLNRRVHWRRLLVAGGLTSFAATMFGMATTIYMPGLVERAVGDFGLFGITIAIIGWLLAVSAVVVASTVVGAEFDQSSTPWLTRVKTRYGLVDPDHASPGPMGETEASGLTSQDLYILGQVLTNWLIMAAAVWAATLVVPGIDVHGGFPTYLAVSLLLGLVNAILGPLLRLVAMPLNLVTMGLFALVTNGVLLAVTAALTDRLEVSGFADAVLGALVISVIITLREVVARPPADDDM